jgi:LysM repeat protein
LLVLVAGPCLAQNGSTHTVEAGETLFGIAEQYQVSVQQLRSWNEISGSGLSIGQKLVIKEGSLNSEAKPESGSETDTESGNTHTVKPKESLYSISKIYGVSIDDIKNWNGLQGNELSVGQELEIRSAESSQPSSPEPSSAQQPSISSSTQATVNSEVAQSRYTVKSGDSLFRIAKLHNMTVNRLKALNDLSSNNLQVGQKLQVQPTDRPPSIAAAGVNSSAQGKFIRYTLKETKSRSELLEKFQMDETEFRALNPGRNSTSFRSGDTVNLLAPANQSFKNPYQAGSSMSSLGTTQASRYKDKAVATTTSGELYNPKALTGAHSSMAMGSVIFVQNSANRRGVLVRINDRTTDSGLKLSEAAWDVLALSGNNAQLTLFRSND